MGLEKPGIFLCNGTVGTSLSKLLACTKGTQAWQGRAKQKTAERDRPHYTTENSLHDTNSFSREFHYVYVIDYITQINCPPEKYFLYVMILVPTVYEPRISTGTSGLELPLWAALNPWVLWLCYPATDPTSGPMKLVQFVFLAFSRVT